jgi:hypothetical protein
VLSFSRRKRAGLKMEDTRKNVYNIIIDTLVNSGLSTIEIFGLLELAKLQLYTNAREASEENPEALPEFNKETTTEPARAA